jgi:hypothetical protein
MFGKRPPDFILEWLLGTTRFSTVATTCIYVFHIMHTINNDYGPKQQESVNL